VGLDVGASLLDDPRLILARLGRSQEVREAFDDHDEVAGREAGFSPATCDPGLDVLGAIIDNRAHPSRRENGALYMREALLQSVHGLLPFALICSSRRARRSASSKVSTAFAVFATSWLSDAASPGVISPSAAASATADAAAIKSEATLILGIPAIDTGRSLTGLTRRSITSLSATLSPALAKSIAVRVIASASPSSECLVSRSYLRVARLQVGLAARRAWCTDFGIASEADPVHWTSSSPRSSTPSNPWTLPLRRYVTP
jgi:hypothetical protein